MGASQHTSLSYSYVSSSLIITNITRINVWLPGPIKILFFSPGEYGNVNALLNFRRHMKAKTSAQLDFNTPGYTWLHSSDLLVAISISILAGVAVYR